MEKDAKDTIVKSEDTSAEQKAEKQESKADEQNAKTEPVEGEISIDKDDEADSSNWLIFVKKHQVIFLAGSIILFLAIVALIAILFFRDKGEVDFSGGVKGNKWMGPVVSFSLNALLADDGENNMKNLETEVFLELSSDDVIEEVVEKKGKLNDIFLSMITAKQAKEVDSLAEQTRLKERILELSNAYLHTGKVKKVYFTKFRIIANSYMAQGDAP